MNAIFRINVYSKGNHRVELSTPSNINIFSLDQGVRHSYFLLFSKENSYFLLFFEYS